MRFCIKVEWVIEISLWLVNLKGICFFNLNVTIGLNISCILTLGGLRHGLGHLSRHLSKSCVKLAKCEMSLFQFIFFTQCEIMKSLKRPTLINPKAPQKCVTCPSQVPRPTCGSGSGERRVCTRGIFLQWPIVAKIFIESGQLRTELACSTRDLALSHWPNSQKCTGCGCRAVFLPSSSLPLALLRFATCIFRIFPTGFLSDSCSIFVSAVKLHASAFTSIPFHWKEHETWTALAILVIACQLRVASLTAAVLVCQSLIFWM